MKYLIPLLLAISIMACGPSRRGPLVPTQGISTGIPGITMVASHSVTVSFPDWLTQWPSLRRECVSEINAAGYPAGWHVTVTVYDFQPPGWEGLIATGWTSGARETILGFTPVQGATTNLLPAVVYEAANARAGGAESGGPQALSQIQAVLRGAP